MKKFLLKNGLQFALALLCVFGIWWIAYWWVGNELLFPSPFACLKEVFYAVGKKELWVAFSQTVLRVGISFLFAFTLAVVLGVLAYLYPAFGGFLHPIVSALRSLPVLAVALIFLVALGKGKTPVAVAFLSLFPMLYAGVLSALSSVDKERVEMSKVYKVPLQRRVFSLYLPTACPYLLRETGASLSFALKLVVSAEVVAGTFKSLGGMMQDARLDGEMPTLFALVILSFLCGILLEGVFALGVWLWERGKK